MERNYICPICGHELPVVGIIDPDVPDKYMEEFPMYFCTDCDRPVVPLAVPQMGVK